jgi:hypothetical protein
MIKQHYRIISTTYAENNDIEGKRKTGQPIVPFPFSPSFLISKLKTELIECACIKQEAKRKS